MSNVKEQLSAYLDDAVDSEELKQMNVEAMEQAAADKALARYSLIGDAMRGELNEATMMDVSQQVHQAIANEAPVTAPVVKPTPVRDTEKRSWFDFSSWFQPAAGLAIAASVAMVVVVTLDQQVDTGSPTAVGPVATQSSPQPVVAEAPAVRTVAASNEDEANNINLNQYLDEHSEFAASDTLQGRLPYVRAVGYKSH